MTLGQRLAEARKLAGISAKELDRLAAISPGHTWLIEKSETGNVETKTLDAIARVIGVSLDYLVRGEGEAPTEAEVQAAVASARGAGEPVQEGPSNAA